MNIYIDSSSQGLFLLIDFRCWLLVTCEYIYKRISVQPFQEQAIRGDFFFISHFDKENHEEF